MEQAPTGEPLQGETFPEEPAAGESAAEKPVESGKPDASNAVAAYGTWGELKWTLSDEGVLNVTGSGAMKDFGDNTFSYDAWSQHARSVTSVVIASGITSIANYAFLTASI